MGPLKEKDIWRMWYASGIKLYYENNTLKSEYDIKYAESLDGIEWKRNGRTSIRKQNWYFLITPNAEEASEVKSP